ncbi:flavoprotein [Salininema proteolyticum]|uniref:Flavoprotein n=1 Tax=Salininema proteolyticum TaxID=1607685 RepID=A0ABV8U2Y8_9ACTN
MTAKVIYLVICAAGPAPEAATFVHLAHQHDADVHIITTPSARDFIDTADLEQLTGNPVVSEHRSPGEPRRGRPPAGLIVVAPATANTVCKLATGIADNYALDVVSESIGAGVPTTVIPFVNRALATRLPYREAVEQLRAEGIRLVMGSGGDGPHEPGQGSSAIETFPWQSGLTRE